MFCLRPPLRKSPRRRKGEVQTCGEGFAQPAPRRAHKPQQLSASSRREAGVWRDERTARRRLSCRKRRPIVGGQGFVSFGINLLFFTALRQHGGLEALRDVADQLQRAARQPPGDCGHGAGVRPGANPAGRGAALPTAEQLETSHYQPEGDQSEATDVTGRRIISAQLLGVTCAEEMLNCGYIQHILSLIQGVLKV